MNYDITAKAAEENVENVAAYAAATDAVVGKLDALTHTLGMVEELLLRSASALFGPEPVSDEAQPESGIFGQLDFVMARANRVHLAADRIARALSS